MKKSFCVFIISHGRPGKVLTLRALNHGNYLGPVFIVCDNEDQSVGQYIKNFGRDSVLVFDKPKYASMVDSCDNFQNRKTTTHARNACFDFAAKLGFEYFLVLDDDYRTFEHTLDGSGRYSDKRVIRLLDAFYCFVEMLECDDRIDSICMMQGGDLQGGKNCGALIRGRFPFSARKAMNSFFCKTSRRFWFFSRLNEDVNTYMALGNRGRLFLTIPEMHLHQERTQKTKGGMSEAYLASGTYVKSFYTVMVGPSYASVRLVPAMKRLHHKITWNNAVPKIIDETHKKRER